MYFISSLGIMKFISLFLITKEIAIYFVNFKLYFNFIITEGGVFIFPNCVLHYYADTVSLQILSLCELTEFVNVHSTSLFDQWVLSCASRSFSRSTQTRVRKGNESYPPNLTRVFSLSLFYTLV